MHIFIRDKDLANVPLKNVTMERMRVDEFGESNDEDCGWVNLVFLWGFSLKILSRNFLQYVGIRVFILVCVWNAKCQFFPNRVVWRLDLTTWLSRESESGANCLARLEVLCCSALAGMTLQLLYMLHTCVSFGDLPIPSQSRGHAECTLLSISSYSLTHYPYMNPT